MTSIENAIIVSPLDEKMEQELVKYNVTDAVIARLKEQYGSLKLRTPDDKEMYIVIKQAAKDCAKVRNAAAKACKEGRDEALKIQKQWIAKEKEVLGKIAEVESPLDAQIAAYDNHAKELEQQEKRRQEEQYMSRTQALTKINALYHDASFTLGDFTLEASLVKESSPEVWENEILPRFMEEHLKIEGERVEKEKKEAAAKLKFEQEQAEFRKQKEEYERQRQEAEQERQNIRNKLQNDRWRLLLPYLKVGDSSTSDILSLWSLSADAFEQLLSEKKGAFEFAETQRLAQMQEAIAHMERERIEEEQRQFAIRKQQEEAKRQEELAKASDKEKWADVVSWIHKCPPHEMRSSQYRTKMKIVRDFVNDILKPV